MPSIKSILDAWLFENTQFLNIFCNFLAMHHLFESIHLKLGKNVQYVLQLAFMKAERKS